MSRQNTPQRKRSHGSDTRYARLFDQAPVGLIELSAAGYCLLANERICELLGCPRRKLEGQPWSAISLPEDFTTGWLACAALISRERPHIRFEHRFRHPQKGVLPTVIHAVAFLQKRQAQVGSLLLSIQPVEQPGPFDPLLFAKERFESILLTTGQVAYEGDPAADRMTFTGHAGNFLEEAGAGIITWQEWLKAVHPEERRGVEKAHRSAIPGKPYHIEYRIIGKNGKISTIRDDGCAVATGPEGELRLVGVLADISEQRGLAMQLHHAQKMEVFGRLAGGVAHDFNNLLTVFSGYTDLLMSEFGECDPRREYLEEMQRAAERASALTSQLLAFGRLQRSIPREIHPGEVLMDVRKMLRRVIGEDIELVIEVGETVGLVFADPRQIETVLINLVVNARDAMPHGGRLSITVADTTLRSNDLRTRRGWKPGPYVSVEVTDTGIGIDPALSSRIFEPFFTTKPPGEGTGLGLATCHGIIEQCGGQIEVESTPGRGSTFRFLLPRLRRASGGDGPGEGKKSKELSLIPRGKGETVLLVEDDLAVQKIYSTMLRRLGYTVICGSNGDEALRIAGVHPEICLVITDVVMPLMSGTDLAGEIRHILPRAKIVLTSGYASEPVETSGALRGTPFLPKPLSRDILASTLRNLIETA